MSVCTFFGHRECYGLDRDLLCNAIETLILQGTDTFYVGNQGQFDALVQSCLRQLSIQYPHIRYAVVLAYLPAEKRPGTDEIPTIYPEGMEQGLKKFAIERRNQWMLSAADSCICYINHSWGGAYKFVKQANARGVLILNLGILQFTNIPQDKGEKNILG